MLLFYGLNGCRFRATDDKKVDLVVAVADGRLDSGDTIAGRLAAYTFHS